VGKGRWPPVINVKSFATLGDVFSNLGQSASAEEAYKEALMLVRAGSPVNYVAQLPDILLGIGNSCYLQDKYQEASQHCRESLAVIPDTCEGEMWDVLRMKNRWFLGCSLWYMGRFLEGIKMMHLSLRESGNSAGVESPRKDGINGVYSLLAQLHGQLLSSSLPEGCSLSDIAAVLEVGVSIFEEAGELEKQGHVLTSQGECSALMGDQQRALEFFQLAVPFLPEHPFLFRCNLMVKIATEYSLLHNDARVGKKTCRQALRLLDKGDESTSSAPEEVLALRVALQASLAQFLKEMETDSSKKNMEEEMEMEKVKGKEKEKEKEMDRHGKGSRRVSRAHTQLARLILEMPPEVILVCKETNWLESSISQLIIHWGPTNSLEGKPKPAKILRFANEFLSKFEHLVPSSLHIKVLCHKGDAERDLRLLSEAHKTLRLALDKARAASDIAAELPVLQALALLEVQLNNHENALKLALRAKELAISWGKPLHTLLMLESIAYRRLGKLEEAVACDQQARSLEPPIPGVPNTVSFEGSFCTLLDSLPPEERLAKLADVPIDGNPALLARKGDALFKLGKFQKALKWFTEAYKCKQDMNFMAEIFGCYRGLGDFKQANEWGLRYLEHWEADQEHVRGDDELNQSILSMEISVMFTSVAITLALNGEIETSLEVCERGRGKATVDLLETRAGVPHKTLTAANIRDIASRLNTFIVVYSISPFYTRKSNQRETGVDFVERHLFIWAIPPSLDQPITFRDLHNELTESFVRVILGARKSLGILDPLGRNFEAEDSEDDQPLPENSLETTF